jgi:hypothetical protein
MKFRVEVECSAPESLNSIEKFEKTSGIKLPSDYKWILLNFNTLRLSEDAMAILFDEDGEEFSGVDGSIFSLNEFAHSSDPYASIEYVNVKAAEEATKSFFVIADLFFQGVLLIGKTHENENRIFGFVPDYKDEPFFLADNIFDFFNKRIRVVK